MAGACMEGDGMNRWGHVWQGGVCGRGRAYRRDGHLSGRYTSYKNAFLFNIFLLARILKTGGINS